jgi:hypothetical protein
MADTQKLKIKVGEHEFEAEGPADVVQAQFADFRDLITSITTSPAPAVAAPVVPAQQEKPNAAQEANNTTPLPHLPLEKILKVEGRVVSLTAKCDTVDHAVLLILLGQKEFRSNQEVSGSEIMDGLKQSGYILGRVDYTLDKLSADGNVITIGIRRGRRYRLTNQGLKQALSTAKEVLTTVV